MPRTRAPHTRPPRTWAPPTRRLGALAVLAAAGSVAVGACGSSHHNAAATTTTTPSATAKFCQGYTAIASALKGLGTANLTQLRSDLKASASSAATVARSEVPKGSGVEGPITAIANDLEQLSTWADTQATAADVTELAKATKLSQLPAAVQAPLQDIQNQATKIAGYVTAHCSTTSTT